MRTPLPYIRSWPLGGVDADGRLNWTLDDQSVREVMLNILLTRPSCSSGCSAPISVAVCSTSCINRTTRPPAI